MFKVNQIVAGHVAGYFVILALKQMNGVDGAQLKEVNPETHETAPGELWLPLSALKEVRASLSGNY